MPDMNVRARRYVPREPGRAGDPLSVVRDVKRAKPTTSESHAQRRARFRAVYDANYHRVLGYALRRTASREDAEDVVAEVFLTAWRRLDQVPSGAGARAWLYGVARKALANNRRADRRRERLTRRLETDFQVLLPDRADGDRAVALVGAAFARLRADEREVLALVAWEELDAGEIATVLGCSRNAARIRLHRARRRLARELQRTSVENKDSLARGLADARSLISPEVDNG